MLPSPCLLQERRVLGPPCPAMVRGSGTYPLQPHSLCQPSSPRHRHVSSKQTAMLTQPAVGVWAQVAPALIQLSAAPRTPGCARRQCQEWLRLTQCTFFFSIDSQESCCSSTIQPYAGSQRGVGSWRSHPAPSVFPAARLFACVLDPSGKSITGFPPGKAVAPALLEAGWFLVPRQKAKCTKFRQTLGSASSKVGHSSSGRQRLSRVCAELVPI